MTPDFIAIGLIIIFIGVVVFILAKKFPVISSIDVTGLESHKQEKRKKDLISRRLQRKLGIFKLKQKISGSNEIAGQDSIFKRFHGFVKKLENQYQEKIRKVEPLEEGSADKKKMVLMHEAKELASQQKFKEAEEKYIEVISLDNKYNEAYEHLAEVYVEQKDYTHAKEIYEFLLKSSSTAKTDDGSGDAGTAIRGQVNAVSLNKEVAEYHIGLGEVFLSLGNTAEAWKNFEEAIKLEPNNPRNLDLIISAAIQLKDKKSALQYIEKLKTANSENEKLDDFKRQADEL
ncbi:MAG: hypothetical protein WCV50_01385 [Patescibacteria group bacterium]|jgi:tetratricopeptide (TPR) repeat protein